MRWLHRVLGADELEVWRLRARASVLDLNDGIVSAAGIAEGFASAGASDSVLLVAAVATVLAGGLAAAGARYTEVRTEWEMNRALVEAERASIEADPDGEFEELVGIYQAKGLGNELARQVAAALTERDPVAAHADAELRLDDLGATSGAVLAGVAAGISYGVGAALPLTVMRWLPSDERMVLTFVVVLIALGLTGWFASWLTGLSALRLVRRNVVLGGATMAASLLIGLVIEL
jgi:VIT1/CCC1 family predicted Fe2+/Mn2+ transporter